MKLANLVKDALAFAVVAETKLDEATDTFGLDDFDDGRLWACWRDAQRLVADLESLSRRLEGK